MFYDGLDMAVSDMRNDSQNVAPIEAAKTEPKQRCSVPSKLPLPPLMSMFNLHNCNGK